MSKWAKARAVRQITTKEISKFVYEDICCKHGIPLEILSDKGPEFYGELLVVLCRKFKIKHVFTTPYYPLCNGMNERFNGELI